MVSSLTVQLEDRGLVVDVVTQPRSVRVPARHEAGPGGRARRIAPGVPEEQAVRRQAVDDRRVRGIRVLAVRLDQVHAEVIGHDQEDVASLLRLFGVVLIMGAAGLAPGVK
jgi:hypothetical protein